MRNDDVKERLRGFIAAMKEEKWSEAEIKRFIFEALIEEILYPMNMDEKIEYLRDSDFFWKCLTHKDKTVKINFEDFLEAHNISIGSVLEKMNLHDENPVRIKHRYCDFLEL